MLVCGYCKYYVYYDSYKQHICFLQPAIYFFKNSVSSIMQEDLFFSLAICNFSWGYKSKYILTSSQDTMTGHGDHFNQVQLGEPVGLLEYLTDAWVTQRQPHHKKPILTSVITTKVQCRGLPDSFRQHHWQVSSTQKSFSFYNHGECLFL